MGTATLVEPSGTNAATTVRVNDERLVDDMVVNLETATNIDKAYSHWEMTAVIPNEIVTLLFVATTYGYGDGGTFNWGADGVPMDNALIFLTPTQVTVVGLHVILSELAGTHDGSHKFTFRAQHSASSSTTSSWSNMGSGVTPSTVAPEVDEYFSGVDVTNDRNIRVQVVKTGSPATCVMQVTLRLKSQHVS